MFFAIFYYSPSADFFPHQKKIKCRLYNIIVNFILLVFLILITLVLSGISIWLLEHRRNPGHFSKNPFHGIGSGLWWSATTITTVGYGDKSSVTFWGRLLAFFWMLTGITLVSVFTATITSMCTVSRLGNVYEHPRTCKINGSASLPARRRKYFCKNPALITRFYSDTSAIN